LLASFDKRSLCRKLEYFLEAEDNKLDNFESNNFADETIREYWKLFCDIMELVIEEALFCFLE